MLNFRQKTPKKQKQTKIQNKKQTKKQKQNKQTKKNHKNKTKKTNENKQILISHIFFFAIYCIFF